jgi:anti-anti-sigma regulatory factor
MLQRVLAAPLTERRIVVIDLIGDLDADLGASLTETLDDLTNRGDCDVVISFRHVAGLDGDGLAGAAKAIAQFRLAGGPVSVTAARSRRVRSMLKASRIPFDEDGPTMGCNRHIMIARHAQG